MKKTLAVLSAMAIVVGVQAETISVIDGTANNYGKTSGVAIDFDATTGLSADWTPDLVAGQQYRVDSVSLFLGGQGLVNEDLYLGVYTGLDEQLGTQGSASLSGFLGVSDNTFNLSTAALNTALTWNFTGNGFQVTSENNPGTGGDVLYFMLQTGTGALTDTGSIQSDDRPFRRIDGYPDDTAFSDYLSATIHGNRNDSLNDADLVPSRPLEYEAQITVIPEPATLGMVALFGGGILFIRRRMMI